MILNDTSRRFWRMLFLTLIVILLIFEVAQAQGISFTFDRWVIGAGGGRAVDQTGTVIIELDGTIGQPIIGQSTGGVVMLSSGFWVGTDVEHSLFLPITIR